MGQVIELTPDLVLMDIGLDGDTDDVATATRIRDLGQVPVVYLTANADDRTLARARLAEPFGYVLKPFEDSQLRTAIEIALYKHGAERKLLESERRYAVTLSSIGDGVIVTDDASRVIFMNGAAEKLTGFSSAEAGGRPLDEVFQVRPENAPALARGQETNVSALGRRTTWILSRHGHDVLIDGSVAPIVDDRGKAMGQVVVFRDIAELREAAEASSRIDKVWCLAVDTSLKSPNDITRPEDQQPLREPRYAIDSHSVTVFENRFVAGLEHEHGAHKTQTFFNKIAGIKLF